MTISSELSFFTLSPIQPTMPGNDDSIRVTCEQPIFHKNVPGLPYKISRKYYGYLPSFSESINDLPMGMWQITKDIWKNSIHTTVKDSIYFEYAETKTYKVIW